jgi:hypothetical protein
MSLSPAQKATLKAAILADGALASLPMTNAAGQVIADAFNLNAVPAFIVERTSLSRHEILTGTSSTGSTFAWAGGAYITRAQGERDAFREMFNSTGSVNPSLASIKAAFADIFSGAGGAGNRAHITALSKRNATRAEKLYATGTGTDANPATLVFEGSLTFDDVVQARELV